MGRPKTTQRKRARDERKRERVREKEERRRIRTQRAATPPSPGEDPLMVGVVPAPPPLRDEG